MAKPAGRRIVATAMLAILAGGTAPAQTRSTCWRDTEVGAARVRQMQTMLMVAALRCRAARFDIIAAYDGFVTAQAESIAAANLVIKQHFAAAGGAQADYDRFATSLANGFGDDETTEQTCAEAAAIAQEAGAARAPGTLDHVAAARMFPASLPGGACTAPAFGAMQAVAARSATATPIVRIAGVPTATPVTLPPEIVSALGVMARLQRAAPAPDAPTQVAAIAR